VVQIGGGGHPWIPNAPEEVRREMLKKIGVKNVEELFRDIPSSVRFKGSWDDLEIGFKRELSEIEVKRVVEGILSKNRVFKNPPPFLGGGAWPHYVPAAVRYVVSRGEFYTAYTPYQAEISQGLMQALVEYQSMMADLLEMEVVNSSMYDWASALAEAFLMAVRVKRGRRRILVPSTMNPFHKSVAKTYTSPKGIMLEEVGYNPETGLMDLEDLDDKLSRGDVAAVYVENPSFLGFIEENAGEVGEAAHEKDALFIVGVDPISLGVLEAPGPLGADIAVGVGQPLGLGLCYGGPYLGIFAVRWDASLVRQMPGRIMGLTTTKNGERAFAMILQTREQHIRRERATSNICTNEMLCALAAAVYMALLGKRGFRRLGELIMYRSHYAAKKLNEINGVKAPLLKSEFFKEFTVNFNGAGVGYGRVHEHLLNRGIHGGLYLREYFPQLGETALFCVTELHTKENIDLMVKVVREVVEGG